MKIFQHIDAAGQSYLFAMEWVTHVGELRCDGEYFYFCVYTVEGFENKMHASKASGNSDDYEAARAKATAFRESFISIWRDTQLQIIRVDIRDMMKDDHTKET